MRVAAVIAVSDLKRARVFYEDQLGLAGRESPGGWVVEAGDGTACHLLPGIDTAGSADWPVETFAVEDVGTTSPSSAPEAFFLGPSDLPFALDEDGVSSDTPGIRVAWMRDPDGSVLRSSRRNLREAHRRGSAPFRRWNLSLRW